MSLNTQDIDDGGADDDDDDDCVDDDDDCDDDDDYDDDDDDDDDDCRLVQRRKTFIPEKTCMLNILEKNGKTGFSSVWKSISMMLFGRDGSSEPPS